MPEVPKKPVPEEKVPVPVPKKVEPPAKGIYVTLFLVENVTYMECIAEIP